VADDPVEARELERAADWRIAKLGVDPADAQSAAAAKLLQKLADDLRRTRGSPAYTEYLAILSWLGESVAVPTPGLDQQHARVGILGKPIS
jgi:hypothetical protein